MQKLLQGKNKFIVIAVASLLALCILCAGGYGIWWLATAPSGAVDFSNLSAQDINALYRQRSNRSRSTPPRLDDLLGPLDDDRLAFTASESRRVSLPDDYQFNGNSPFADQQWLLTDKETYERLADLKNYELEPEIMRELQIRALTKLALTQNAERVVYYVEYVELPEGGQAANINEFVDANGGTNRLQSQGGFSYEFSVDWVKRTPGLPWDIKTVADTRESFDAFMRDLETFEPVSVTVIPR